MEMLLAALASTLGVVLIICWAVSSDERAHKMLDLIEYLRGR
jgi:hypothetical protein